MSWRRLNDEEPELYYSSKAKTKEEITADIYLVFNRMMDRRGEENAEDAEGLAFIINATNGYISMVWYNPTTKKAAGTWKYELKIEDFWQLSIDHQEGAFFFDNETYMAIFNFMDQHIYDETGKELVRVFVRRDIGGLNELVI